MKKFIISSLLLFAFSADAWVSNHDISRVGQMVVEFQGYDGSVGLIGKILGEGVGSILSLSLPCFTDTCRIERVGQVVVERINYLRSEVIESRSPSEISGVNNLIEKSCQVRNIIETSIYLFEGPIRASNCAELLITK